MKVVIHRDLQVLIVTGFVSAVQRRKHMGQKSDDTFLSYLSDISGLNTQDMVNGRAPDNLLMESLQSMALSFEAPVICIYGVRRACVVLSIWWSRQCRVLKEVSSK